MEDDSPLAQNLQVGLANKKHHTRDSFLMPHIQLGTIMFVELIHENLKQSCRCPFLGCKRGEFFLLGNPHINGLPANFSSTRRTAVRYFVDGSVFGFETEILRSLGTPFFVTFFKYPTSIEEVSLRRSPRVQMVLPFSRENGDAENEYILDLCVSGALLQVMEPVSVNDELLISFRLPNGDCIDAITATVRRVDWHHDRILAGVSFDPKHPSLPLLKKYIDVVLERLIPLTQ